MAESTVRCREIKRKFKEYDECFNYRHVAVSLCNNTPNQRRNELEQAIIQSCDYTKESSVALSCLLDELVVSHCMSFLDAFYEFAGKVPTLANKKITKETPRQFRDKIISERGFPVVVLDTSGGQSFLMLLECPLDKAPLCRSLDVFLGCGSENELGGNPHLQPQLASCIPTFFKLMSSAKDRAILTFVLSSIFSTTSLTLTFGLQNSQVTRVKEKLNDILNDVDSAQKLSEEEAQRQIESTISKLEIDLEKEGQLNSKRPRLAEEEIEVRSFQLKTKAPRQFKTCH